MFNMFNMFFNRRNIYCIFNSELELHGTHVLNTNWPPRGIQYLRYFKYFNGTCLFTWSLNIHSRLFKCFSEYGSLGDVLYFPRVPQTNKVLTGQCKAHEGNPTDNDRILRIMKTTLSIPRSLPKTCQVFLTNNATVTNYICTSKEELKLKSF